MTYQSSARWGIRLVVALTILFSPNSLSAQLKYTRVVIDPSSPPDPWMKSIGDLNGDGLPDLVVASASGPVVWYAAPNWTKSTIATDGSGDSGSDIGDIDGDGDNDVIVGMTWYENLGNGTSWLPHTLDGYGAHDILIVDINNDGKADIIMRGEVLTLVNIYLQINKTTWNKFSVEPGIGLNGLDIADINGDGRLDVIVGGAWMENPGGDISTTTWPKHIFTTWDSHASVKAVDMDADGKLDVILSVSEGGGNLSWFKAPADPRTGPWAETIIDSNLQHVHGFVVADLNHDGLLDVTASEYLEPGRLIAYLNRGNAKIWQAYVLGTDYLHNIRGADLNNDGIMDFFGVYAWGINPVIIYVSQPPPPPPAAPVLATPADGATGIAMNPTVTWNASTGAASYRLQVSTDAGFGTTAVDQSNITTTSYAVSGLTGNTTYYWRVNATNAGGTSAYSSTWSFTTAAPPPPPSAPTLSSPSNGATGVSITPTLGWNASSGADSYGLQVSTNSNFSTTVVNQTGITTTSYAVSGLAGNTTYYWRVNATNAAGASAYSTTWSFTTVRSTSITVADTIRSNDRDAWSLRTTEYIGNGDTYLEWGFGATRADSEQVGLGFTLNIPQGKTIDSCFITVRAQNVNGFDGATDTTSIYGYNVDNVAAFVEGAAHAIINHATTTSQAVAWVVPSSSSAINTNITTPNIASLLQTIVNRVGWSANNYAGFVFRPRPTVHVTKVIWITNYNNGTASKDQFARIRVVYRDTTAIPPAPLAPTLSSPSNGATNVSTNPTLSWNVSTGATSYGVQVSTDPSFSATVVNQSNITTTSYAVSGLTGNTTYYWRVNATNAGGTSAYSATWNFTTAAVVSPPTAPTLASPANGATGLSTSLTLTWNASTGATSYGVQVSTDPSFSATVVNQSNITTTSYAVNGLTGNTTYYWHVNATNSGGTSAYSSTWSFATAAPPPPPSAPTLSLPSNGATSISTNPTLSWSASAGAASYRLQVSTDAGFGTTAVDQSNITTTSYAVSGLASSTTYYWHVDATNAGGTSSYSATWSFTTSTSTTVTISDTIKSNDRDGISLGTSEYQGIGDVAIWWGFGNTRADSDQVGLQFRLNIPQGRTIDSCFITAYVQGVNGFNGTTDTTSIYGYNVDNVATFTEGATHAIINHAAITSQTIAWVVPSSTSTNITTPNIASLLQTIISRAGWVANNYVGFVFRPKPTVALTHVAWITNYNNGAVSKSQFARIRVVYRDTTAIPPAPLAPTLSSPSNGATNVSTNPTLSWNVSTGATSYGVQVSTDPSFSATVVNQSNITTTSYAVSGLTGNTTYYWHVNATNSGGTSAYSTAWNFTTAAPPPPPAAPVLATPANGATGIAMSPTVTWNASTGAASYRLQVSTDAGFGTTAVDQSNITTTSYAASGLTGNTTYYWHVNATNSGGTSAYSTAWNFTTAALKPGLAAAYSFSEGSGSIVADASGNNNRGTINGATWNTQGKFGNALSFNGTSSYVAVPNSPSIQSPATAITVSTWVNPNGTSQSGSSVLQKINSSNSLSYAVGQNSSNTRRFSGYLQVNGTQYATPAAKAMTNLTWYYVALTWQSGQKVTLRIYNANGSVFDSVKTTQSPTGSINYNSSNLVIGVNGSGRYWKGTIDEVRIYSRVLTQVEIQNDMGTPIPPLASTVVSSAGGSAELTTLTRENENMSTRSVSDQLSEIPSDYVLEQNYPNPFNPSTVFEFAAPKQSHISLELYNLLGERVATIIDGTLSAGYYSVPFNATRIASGVYFYRMRAGDFVQTRKLLILK